MLRAGAVCFSPETSAPQPGRASVEALHGDHAKPDNFNTPSTHGPALSMGVATAAGRHKAEGAEGADVAFNDEHLKDFKIFGRIITKQDANSLNMS